MFFHFSSFYFCIFLHLQCYKMCICSVNIQSCLRSFIKLHRENNENVLFASTSNIHKTFLKTHNEINFPFFFWVCFVLCSLVSIYVDVDTTALIFLRIATKMKMKCKMRDEILIAHKMLNSMYNLVFSSCCLLVIMF